MIAQDADVVAVLTGNVLKDPDYIYRYHTGKLEAPSGVKIRSTFGNQSIVVPNDPDRIAALVAVRLAIIEVVKTLRAGGGGAWFWRPARKNIQNPEAVQQGVVDYLKQRAPTRGSI